MVAAGSFKVGFGTGRTTGYYFSQWYNHKSNSNIADWVTVAGGQTTSDINAQLDTGGRICGRVTDSAGQGLAQTNIGPNDTNNIWPAGGQTDSNGNYCMLVSAGTYRVRFVS